ncbi:hypothetical protein J31TS4_23870 [Paenibacillus sp. J31TS4]|uniref:CPBP family intramembrane glutamic endopeptidase n=1 Tax=Paenibacillus sp. J31TS4 TaxID=2807195 RepID=UPI001B0EF5F1|nr:CPBP family intramembrane glutamic endopeptidase [Paenibacillus sp. J31TS4]GIP39107.1 hypothetical protein J31TS4_23870 [Paenibacillus sp. J31TS4]
MRIGGVSRGPLQSDGGTERAMGLGVEGRGAADERPLPAPHRLPLTPLIGFVLAVVLVQLLSFWWGAGLLVLAALLGLRSPLADRPLWWMTGLYIAGYGISVYGKTDLLAFWHGSREAGIVLSRLSLLGFLLPLCWLARWRPGSTNYFALGSFRAPIHTPFIWRGIRDPVWRFLLIFLAVTGTVSVFLIDFGREDLPRLLGYGLLFAVVNAVLEEWLWRGYVLARLVDAAGERAGLLFAGAAFGLYHYSIGFPWLVCLLFIPCGWLMGGVTIRSGGLLPVLILHIVMNVVFVLTGLVF